MTSTRTIAIFLLALSACHPGAQGSHTSSGRASADPALPAGPWYDTFAFTPTDTVVAGLRLAALDSTWAAASALSPSLLPPAAFADSVDDPIRASDFGISADFNHDGTRDSALVGVYRTHSDTLGRFLLILTQTPQGWQKAYLLSEPPRPSYSGVTGDSAGLSWWACRRCDYSFDIAWDGTRYKVLSPQTDTE